MDKLLDFTGQTVLITGAAKGFGALLAWSLAKRGANLVLGDINTQVHQVSADINADDACCGNAISMINDVSNYSDCQAITEKALEEFGRLDIAVNNAGVAPPMVATEFIEEQHMDSQFAINVKSVAAGMKYQLPIMREQGVGF